MALVLHLSDNISIWSKQTIFTPIFINSLSIGPEPANKTTFQSAFFKPIAVSIATLLAPPFILAPSQTITTVLVILYEISTINISLFFG